MMDEPADVDGHLRGPQPGTYGDVRAQTGRIESDHPRFDELNRGLGV